MPSPEQTAAASLVLSIAVATIAALLAIAQYLDWRRREDDLPEDDSRHFARQDVRRAIGVVVMILLAFGIYFGSRIEPRAAGRTNPLFVQVWLVVFILIFVLLILALIDWFATRLYARRHRRVLFDERIEALRDELRHRGTPGNGRPGSFDGFAKN